MAEPSQWGGANSLAEQLDEIKALSSVRDANDVDVARPDVKCATSD